MEVLPVVLHEFEKFLGLSFFILVSDKFVAADEVEHWFKVGLVQQIFGLFLVLIGDLLIFYLEKLGDLGSMVVIRDLEWEAKEKQSGETFGQD